MRSLLMIILIILSLRGVAQVEKPQLHLKAIQRECVLTVNFVNKSKKTIKIPDVSFRSDTLDGYKVLSKDNIEQISDTLVIKFSSIKSEDEKNEVSISDQVHKGKIVVKYKDIDLHRMYTQYIRVPSQFCNSNYNVLVIKYDGVLLGRCNLNP